MAGIVIKDLRTHHELDNDALSRVRGALSRGGASWLYGWPKPYVDSSELSRGGPHINFYQTNNYYIADQINNEIAMIDVRNSAANAIINVNAKQQAMNLKLD